jgi:putative membrane protein
MIITLILSIALAIVAVFFSLENTTQIQVSFFGYPVQGPDGLFMLISLGVGALLGVIVMIPSLIGRSWTLMQHKRRIAKLEQNDPMSTPPHEES